MVEEYIPIEKIDSERRKEKTKIFIKKLGSKTGKAITIAGRGAGKALAVAGKGAGKIMRTTGKGISRGIQKYKEQAAKRAELAAQQPKQAPTTTQVRQQPQAKGGLGFGSFFSGSMPSGLSNVQNIFGGQSGMGGMGGMGAGGFPDIFGGQQRPVAAMRRTARYKYKYIPIKSRKRGKRGLMRRVKVRYYAKTKKPAKQSNQMPGFNIDLGKIF